MGTIVALIIFVGVMALGVLITLDSIGRQERDEADRGPGGPR